MVSHHARGIVAAREVREADSQAAPPAAQHRGAGCGSGEKLAILTANGGEPTTLIQLVDISPAALDMAQYRLEAIGYHNVLAHQSTYEEGLVQVARSRPTEGALILLFLGSNIGNFDPPVARELLRRIRAALRPGDAFLLGSDLVKPERDLLLAYDDPLHVTAAFNRNLLRRINDELDATFDLEAFAHRALWDRGERRVEMRLVSRRRQTVEIGAADYAVTLEAGEEIWTESSHKYEVDQVIAEGRIAGFDGAEQWVDEDARFALTRFMVAVAGRLKPAPTAVVGAGLQPAQRFRRNPRNGPQKLLVRLHVAVDRTWRSTRRPRFRICSAMLRAQRNAVNVAPALVDIRWISSRFRARTYAMISVSACGIA